MSTELERRAVRVGVSEPTKPLRPVFELESGQLYQADCLDLLNHLSEQGIVVDMVFADPPYNLGKAGWDRFNPDAYLRWTVDWIGKAALLIRNGGSLFVMGFPETLADVKYLATRAISEFTSCRWLVWHYRNKPSLNSHDWVRSHEAILHLRKGPGFTFNIDSIREPYNSHTLNYPGHEHGRTSQYGDGRDEEGNVYVWQPATGGAKPRDVLILPAICNQTEERVVHPTQKPEELLRKFVLATTRVGQTVLDPFGGSGTTYVACVQTGRRWIGGESNPDYCRVIEERVRGIPKRPLSYWLSIDKAREDNRTKVRGKKLGKLLG